MISQKGQDAAACEQRVTAVARARHAGRGPSGLLSGVALLEPERAHVLHDGVIVGLLGLSVHVQGV